MLIEDAGDVAEVGGCTSPKSGRMTYNDLATNVFHGMQLDAAVQSYVVLLIVFAVTTPVGSTGKMETVQSAEALDDDNDR